MVDQATDLSAQPAGDAFAPGTVVAGKYRIDRVINSGGMGLILVGKHLLLDQKFAMKVLRSHALADPELVARFAREARAAAQIQSEHVARVYDVGILDSGIPFMVMEYLRGTDLSGLLKAQGPLPVETTLDYLLQACEALAEAHKAGIVHRDLKPANIFLTRRADGSPLIKVLDFGISKISDRLSDADFTKSSRVMGSPHFMSPEQLTSARTVDARADIWALGVVLFKLLSGKYPFVADSSPELCVAILMAEPSALRTLCPSVPEGLEAVILRCLAKAPEKRFPDIGAFATAVAPFASAAARSSVDRIVKVLGNDGAFQSTSEHPGPPVPTEHTRRGIGPDGLASVEAVDIVVDETAMTPKPLGEAAPISGDLADAVPHEDTSRHLSRDESIGAIAGVPKKRSGVMPIGAAAIAILLAVVIAMVATRRGPSESSAKGPEAAQAAAGNSAIATTPAASGGALEGARGTAPAMLGTASATAAETAAPSAPPRPLATTAPSANPTSRPQHAAMPRGTGAARAPTPQAPAATADAPAPPVTTEAPTSTENGFGGRK